MVDLEEAVVANVRQSVMHLQQGSDILGKLVDSGEILVVGAKYSIETGEVEFLDE